MHLKNLYRVDPIEEIDGKKPRNLAEMQRNAAYLRTLAQKSKTPAAKTPEPETKQASDQLEFSSEFTSQDMGLAPKQDESAITSWEDLLEDDDWDTDDDDEEYEEDEDESEGAEEYSAVQEEAAEPEAEPDPPAFPRFGAGGGWKPAAPRPEPDPEPEPYEEPAPEEQAGFQWEALNKSKRVEGPGSAEPDLTKDSPLANPRSLARGGGWKQTTRQQPAVPPRPRPTGGLVLPNRGQIQQVEPKIVSAARLLITTPEDEPGYEECLRLLSRFGLGALRLCNRSEVKVEILDEAQFVKHPQLVEFDLDPEETPVDGAYLVETRTCLIDRRTLTEKPRFFHPALYYFAHALDHAQGGEEFSSRKAAAVGACFHASSNGDNGCDFVDELAGADPVRYFARSVAIYLGRDDCDEPIWTHQDLFDFDRSMYDYLQYLFARFTV